MTLKLSWVGSANDAAHPFPPNNLPYGVFSTEGGAMPRCGVAIGDMIFDLCRAEAEGLLKVGSLPMFDVPYWNDFMELGPEAWANLRERLTELLARSAEPRPDCLVAQADAQMHMPFQVSEYTDFFADRNHAKNIGTMFCGPDNALPPNWLHIPIGYKGRASSVVVSGTDVRHPAQPRRRRSARRITRKCTIPPPSSLRITAHRAAQ